jgi:hypothetical protein
MWRRRVSRTVPSERCEGWSASYEGTATRQGGRANRHNPSNLGGERAMKGKPPGSRALPPAGGPEAAALKNTPPGGLAVLRALDDYQMFTG